MTEDAKVKWPTTCDTCGKPATSLARDVLRHEVPGASWVTFSPAGSTKAGCDDHPVSSVEHLTQLPPARDGDAR